MRDAARSEAPDIRHAGDEQSPGVGLIVTIWSVTCFAAAVLVALDVHTVIRPPLVLAALVGGPGWALAGFLRIRESGLVWAVAVAVGLSVNVALGLAMIAVNSWHPIGASVGLLLASAAVLGARSLTIGRRMLAEGAP